MSRIQYIDKNVRPDTIALIEWADGVASDYSRRGLDLTLRQLYYQGVSANVFPNSERSYKRLGSAVNDGRLLGMIDWSHLSDRGRTAHGVGGFGSTFPTMQAVMDEAKWYFTHDLWAGQEYRVEVWVEKQALEQVASRAADSYRVPYIACKGYMSQSEMWEAGYNRLRRYVREGQQPVIIHLGDHDPSGIDMSRDIEDRLRMFAEADVELRRIALNMDQIDEFRPPPNPAKTTDSRFADYRKKYGEESWELDALRPEMLIDLIRSEIGALIDRDLFDALLDEEHEQQAKAEAVGERWAEIEQYLAEHPAEES
jgi:hypothetical protein